MGEEPKNPAPPASRGRIGKWVHSVCAAILVEGSLLNTFRTALRVLQNEGWSGFRQRVGGALSNSERNDYREWVRRYDTLNEADRERIRNTIARMPQQPLVSVLMPTYNTPTAWLQDAIDSVRSQLYENWELCIADDASTDPAVRDILEKAAARDDRIKVTFREVNGHISAASNSALELCGSDWVALMDHDDLLAEHALYCVAAAINAHPNAQLFYSDEDKISEIGYRFDPYFKCDFNRDLFYSHNMISHLGVYRREVIEKIGGFREGFEGSQDYDLALRFFEHTRPGNIVHVPRVLYHWRRHDSSTASGVASKPYAQKAARRALEEHLARSDTPARIAEESHGYRVKYILPAPHPPVSIVIVAGEDTDQLSRLIESIGRETDYRNFDLRVVGSTSVGLSSIAIQSSGSSREATALSEYDLRTDELATINASVGACDGEYIALLDGKTRLASPEWLTELVAVAAQPGVGAVSAKLLDTHGTVEHAGYVLGLGGSVGRAFHGQPGNAPCYFGRARLMSTFSATSSECMVIKKSRFQQVGGFEENGLSRTFADVDLCLRLREAGFRNILNPNVLLTRLPSATRGTSEQVRTHLDTDLQFLRKRWGDSLLDDPCYSPNLTLDFEDFSLAWPPRVGLL